MGKSTRCMFRCDSVEKNMYSETAKCNAEYNRNIPLETHFASATPSGKFEVQITNTAVHGFFVPGKKYYFDITEVPAEDLK